MLIVLGLFALAKLAFGANLPDISGLSQDTQLSIKMACAWEKTQGPVNYGSCIALHLRSIGVDPSY